MYNSRRKFIIHFSPKIISFLFVFMMICASAQAEEYFWVGGASGDWDNAANWATTLNGTGGAGIPGSNASDTANLTSAATISINSTVQISQLFIPNPNNETASFIVTLTGAGSIEATTKIETVRAAASGAADDATSTLIFECNVTSPSLIMHSGGNITIASGSTANITSIENQGEDSPATLLKVSGTLNSTTIQLSNVTTRKLLIDAGGNVSTTTITGSDDSVTNNGQIAVSNTTGSNLNTINTSGSGTIALAGENTCTWKGNAAAPASNTDWNTAANWQGGIPGSTTAKIIIPATTNLPEIKSGDSVTVDLTKLEVASGASIKASGTLIIDSAYTIDSIINTASSGKLQVNGALTNSSAYTFNNLAFECTSLDISANLQCKSMKVTGTPGTTTLTNTNTSGATYLVATGDDGISFGGNVTVNSSGTPTSGAQFILGGNVTATSAVNLTVASGMLNHVEETTNNHKTWSSNITTVLQNDGCAFGMQNGQSYKTKITATSGDVYLAGSGTISLLDDSSSNAACKLHFGDAESSQENTFTLGTNITLSKITDVVLDASCKGLKGAVTLSGIKNISNLSGQLSAAADKIVPTISLVDGATITGNNVNFDTVTCAGAVTIQPDSGKAFSFDSLTCNGTTSISSNNTFGDFTVSGLGGETLTINGTQAITGTFDLSGTSTSSKLTVSGSGSLALTNTLIAEFLDFTGTGPAIYSGTAFAGNSSWSLAGAPTGWIVVDGTQHVWNGTTTAWGTDTNWLPQSVPDGNTEEVIINTSASSTYPVISSGVTLKSITINAGTVTVNGTGSSLTLAQGTELDTNIKGTGKLILPSGQSFTITGPKEFDINIENSGTLSCTTGAVTFDKTIENKAGSTFTTSVAITATEFIYNSNNNVTFTEAAAIDELSITSTGAVAFSKTLDSTSSVSITAGTLSFGDAVNVKDITMNATTTTSSDITVTGNWTNTGTFTASSPSTVTFTSNTTTYAELHGENTFYDLNLNRCINVYDDNTISNDLTAHKSAQGDYGNIKFASGKTQTVGGKLDFQGIGTGSGQRQSAACITTGGTWYIKCTKTDNDHNLKFVNLSGCNNISPSYSLVALQSRDTGGNTNIDFPGAEYTWLGGTTGHLNDWNWATNWSPASVPGKGSLIIIPNGKTYYPILTAELNLTYNTSYKGKITIAAGTDTLAEGKLDLGGQNVTAGEIVNNGRVRLTGVAGQTITLTRTNNANSVVEYYEPSPSATITNFAWGQNYEKLEINESAEIHTQLTVNNTTTITAVSSKAITLDSTANTFTGNVILGTASTPAYTGDVTLKAGSLIKIANNAYAKSLTVESEVQPGNITTTEDQTYNATVHIDNDATLTVPTGKFINFNSIITGSAKLTTAGAGTAVFNGTVSLGDLDTQTAKIGTTSITTTSGTQVYNGAVELAENTTLTAGTSVSFNANVSGPKSLTVSAPLNINCAQITTSGAAQLYNGTVTLLENTTLSGSTVTFNENVSGSKTLTVSAPLTVNCAQITTTGTTQTYNGTVNLGVNSNFTASQINFNSNITDGAVAGSRKKLTVTSPVLKSTIASGSASIILGELEFAEATTGNTSVQTAGSTTLAFYVPLITGTGKTITLASSGSSFTFDGNVEVNPNLVTSAGTTFTASSGVMTFKADLDLTNGTFAANSGTIVLSAANKGTNQAVLKGDKTYNTLIFTGPVNIQGNNTISTLTANAATLAGKTISFDAGTSQSVTNMTLQGSGTAATQILTLNARGTGNWNISCATEPTLQYLSVSNSTNSSNPAKNFVALNSTDAGSNIEWNFPNMPYKWTGGSDTDWTNTANWQNNVVPTKGANVEIATATHYPLLTAALNLNTSLDATPYNGIITVDSGATLDLGGQSVTAGEIKNNGRVRLTGASTPSAQTITLTKTNNTNSVVEYYLPSGSNTTITNNAWGQNYENLDINAPVNFNSSDLTINAATKIAAGSGKTVNLNNSGNVFKGTVFIGDSSTSVNAGDVTLNGTGNPAAANTTIFLANNTLASQLTLNSNVQGGTLTITAPVTLNNSLIYSSGVQTYNNPITLGTTGNHGFNGSQVIFNNTVSTTVAGTSIEVTGPVTINCTGITTTGTQTYHNNVTLNQTTTLSASTVSLIGNVSNAVTAPAATLTINADTNIASANVTITTAEFDFSNDITVSASANKLTLNTPIVKSTIAPGSTANITLNTLTLSRDNTILTSANASNISITTGKIDGNNKQLTLSNNIQTITFSNGIEIVPVLKIEKVSAIVFAGAATLDNNVLIGTAGDGSDIDKSFYSSSAGIITIKKNLIIDALGGKKVALNCALNSAATSSAGTIRANNVVLYSGDVYLYGNLSSKIDGATPANNIWGDIIVLGNTNYSTADSGITKAYYYNQTRLSSPSFNTSSVAAFTEPFRTGTYEAVLKTMGSATITVGKNFYTNGTSLQSASSNDWSLKLPDISDAQQGFAEAIQTTVSNCKVSCWADPSNTATDDTAPAKVVAYECTVDASTTNWNSEAFSILEAYTVRDNAIYVKFNAPIRNRRNEINNADGSSGTIQYLRYQNATGSTASFEGIYSDPDCHTRIINSNITTNEAGGYKLYIKAPSSWNTDATGKSEGTSKSSDRNGNHKTALPYLDIPRSLAGSGSANPVIYIITNKWGKRLDNYSTRTNSGTAYGSTADTTHNVEDKTGPVLWTVRTGQELHEAYDTAVGETSQHSYDSHNFLEFRYSEPVDIGTISAYSAGTTPNIVENIQVTDTLGAITGNITAASSELTFAGLARFTAPASGSGNLRLYTGSNGAANKYMNALYRVDEYSIRLSVAGWTNGTVSDYSSNEFKKWPGYIESATQFTGATAHTVSSSNNLVKDQEGNVQIEYAHNATHDSRVEPVIISASASSNPSNLLPTSPDLYSAWDLSSPVFTPLRFSSETPWGNQTMSEAIGNTNGSGSTLDRIDFHFFDNTPTYTGSDPAVWYTEIGWCTPGTEASKTNLLDSNYTYCADIIGGARQFDTVAARRTTGGIRFSTKAEIAAAFKYSTSQDNPAPSSPFLTGIGNVHTTIVSQLFTGSSAPMRSANDPDGLYLGLSLSDTNLSVETTFSFSYNEGQGYLTDLAGNRLRSKVSKTIDRTPPSFDVILSPIDSKSIYIIFVKQLVTDSAKIKFRTNAGANIPISESFETLMPKCFRIITIDENGNAVVSTKNQIDTNVPAQIVEENTNNSFTCIKLTTKNDITIDDVKSMYVQLIMPSAYPTQTLDPLTNNINSRVTFIQDLLGNYMSLYGAHALSDFAINYVNPLYAYSTDMTADEMSVMNGLYEEGSWAVHDWNEDQQNYGTLPANHPISIVADTKGNSKIRVYLSPSPDESSVAAQFNKDFDTSLRIWLPNLVDGSFRAFAANNNKNYVVSDGELLNSESSNSIFNISSEVVNNWESGSQITFLFGLMKDAKTPLRIYNTPYFNIATNRFDFSLSGSVPLYSLRMTDIDDINSLDLWSFKLKSITNQRGGVTILNNVINASKGEHVVVKVDMPEDGRLNVIVMTLDGNIISYLNRGKVEAGENYFTWDGKNRNGNSVARGMYFVRVTGTGIDETRKVMVVKD